MTTKCRLFHNATFFGSCIIHILHTECANIKKKSGAKGLNYAPTYMRVFLHRGCPGLFFQCFTFFFPEFGISGVTTFFSDARASDHKGHP
jgi:hypothetical protein